MDQRNQLKNHAISWLQSDDSCLQINVQKEVQMQIKPFTRVHIIQIKVYNSKQNFHIFCKIFIFKKKKMFVSWVEVRFVGRYLVMK